MESWLSVVFEVSTYVVLLPLLAALPRWKKFIPEQKSLWWFILIACLCIQLPAAYLSGKQINNLPLLHIYTVLEFSTLVWIFFKGGIKWLNQKIVLALMAGFGLIAIANAIFLQDIWSYNSYPRALEALVMLIFSLTYFVSILRELQVINLAETFMFWFGTAILLYFSGNLLLFLYSSLVASLDVETNYQIWGIHAVLNILLYSMYTIALWSKPEQRISAKFS